MKALEIVFLRNGQHYSVEASQIESIQAFDSLHPIPGSPVEVLGLYRTAEKSYAVLDPELLAQANREAGTVNDQLEVLLLLKTNGTYNFSIACDEVIGFGSPDGQATIALDSYLDKLASNAYAK